MAPLLSHQPLKAIATLILIASAPLYLAALSLVYVAKKYRPVPEWTVQTAVGNEWLRLFYIYAARIHLQPYFANASRLKDRYVLVQPGPSELYTGIVQSNMIQPAPMPGIWFPEKPGKSEIKSCKVVIHFQGGAFVTATDPVDTGRVPARIFTDKLSAATFYAQYRLSRNEDSRFPAAVQDVISFYRYVLEQGVDPQNIIISGDSAGGNLVIGLLRYIQDTAILPTPRGVMLWSPWVDVSQHALSAYAKSKSLRTDFLSLGLLQWGKAAYEPTSNGEEADRYLRPVKHPFGTHVPIFVNAGTAELFYDDISKFADRMKELEGNKLLYMETKNSPHDVLVAGSFIGFIGEAESAVEQAGAFFNCWD
ncbi:alpha/beta-hydrolase [Lindgomyces ingoldianus]|uniref:Alpha/beta-hydrolase n=1 Tax=Lindgomyces ingoldianus TaxID=673940 RepID=A0ACB6QBJ0_9PLEO|nr:alpha/beta-hydrolase [Lindgomyces ingoldianus]KAF2463870.1 alpha/beta-hydrolase [Lindgomyces ingoldianus]